MYATVSQGLDFLQLLLDENVNGTYSKINTARSALSAILIMDPSFGIQREVVWFMKGVYNLRTPKPKYVDTWNPQVILTLLKSAEWEPADSLSLKRLTLKLCMLTMLVSGQRCEVLLKLKLDCMTLLSNGDYVFQIDTLKQSRRGYVNPLITLKAYPEDDRLCVVNYLSEYLKRTVNIRGDCQTVLVTFQKPHHLPSRSTISRWISIVMSLSGINVSKYKPHSVRMASTSAANRSGVSLDTILAKAGWSQVSTFAKFYERPLESEKGDEFADAVLS